MTEPKKGKTAVKSRRNGRPLPRPFLKWAGGKTQLLREIDGRLPKAFGTYYEPFIGGGAVFFHLKRQKLIEKAVLSDINEELIGTWTIIRDDIDALIPLLKDHKNDETYFYNLRAQDPKKMTQVAQAARMIFLNKTCFNGLYRVNSKGGFNVPFAYRKSPNICDEPNLRAVSEALQGVELKCQDFRASLEQAESKDLVYLDPPYEPRSSTSFTSYTAKGFKQKDQQDLKADYTELTKKGVYAMLSNSDTNFTAELWDCGEGHDIKINLVKAARFINSKAGGRGKINELLVCNYLPDPARLAALKGYHKRQRS